jgi:hypothetical protein
MQRKLTINTSPQEEFAIVRFCERNARSPLEVLLAACGYASPDSEPFIFKVESFVEKRRYPTEEDINEQIPIRRKHKIWRLIRAELDNKIPKPRPHGDQNKVYLALLSQLLKWNNEKASEKLENRRGTKCLLFSRIQSEVEQPHRIPESKPAWYARTKLPAGQKKQILRELLHDLGFTSKYSRLISELVDNRRPQIDGLRFVSDEVRVES